MIVNIAKLSSSISRISDLTSGDKVVPGVLLDITKEDGVESLKVSYTDGQKTFVDTMDIEVGDGEPVGKFAVEFEQINKAISSCQPSGSIKVSDLEIKILNEPKIIEIHAEQKREVLNENGEVEGYVKMANKKLSIVWTNPGDSFKTQILTRINSDNIFNSNEREDVYSTKELAEALSRTSTEKGRNIYISPNSQSIFVSNQAHVTAIPISGVGEEEGNIKNSVVIGYNIAKALVSILNKTKEDEVTLFTEDKWCSIFVEGENDRFGIQFAMPQASRAHIDALGAYASKEYKTYQTTFDKEFLENNVKSVLEDTKSERTTIRFVDSDEEERLALEFNIGGGNVNNTYKISPDDVIDSKGDLKDKTFNVSPKVLSDMLSQMKSTYVALDFDVNEENNSVCIRVAELDMDKVYEKYNEAREETKVEMLARGELFDPETTTTPIEKKLEYRKDTIVAKQYTLLAK